MEPELTVGEEEDHSNAVSLLAFWRRQDFFLEDRTTSEQGGAGFLVA